MENPNRLTGAERREWMGMRVAGILIHNHHGSFPHSLRLAPVSREWMTTAGTPILENLYLHLWISRALC